MTFTASKIIGVTEKNGEWKTVTVIFHSPFSILHYFVFFTLSQYAFASCSVLFGPNS